MALDHVFSKPEKIVSTGLGLLEQELIIAATFQKEGIDEWKGSADDTISVKVEGLLPFHDYEWRSGEDESGDTPANNRQALTFDKYVERKVPISFGGNVYSAVEVTDEQRDFDYATWTDKILSKQVRAVARGLGRRALNTLTAADYAVTIGDLEGLAELDATVLRSALYEARRVLNRFNVPAEGRILAVGTDFEAALLANRHITFSSTVGDNRADTALGEASLGKLAGFDVIVDVTLPPRKAYAYVPSAFVMMTGAPSVPASVKHGASASFEGVAMRWLTDYSADYMVDRSVVNTYAGFRAVKDNLVYWNNSLNSEVVTSTEHFVRGIELDLDGAMVYPDDEDELAIATGVHTAPAFVIPTEPVEPDPEP